MSNFKYAFSLSEDEVKNSTPPGTSVLIDHELERTISGHERRHDRIHLVPPPSADPADPLNFSMWRKCMILAAMSLFAFIGNFQSASIASALPVLAIPHVSPFNPPVPISTGTHLVAVNVLLLGASNLWWVPLANTFGRRPVLIISTLMLTLFSVWAGCANSFNSLLAARIFMGIGAGPSETICPDVLGEIFFVHQRGRALAVYTTLLALGPYVGGIAGGYVAFNPMRGLAWVQWMNVIMAAVLFVLILLFVPETLFDRRKALGLSNDSFTPGTADAKESVEKVERAPEVDYAPFTFGRSLKIGTYRPGIAMKFAGPFLALRLPGVWVVMLVYAGLVGGIVTMSTVGPTVVSSPPYLWGSNAGLINIGGIVGAFISFLVTYAISDWIITRQAKHETHGFSEPETRLPLLFPALFLATTGLWTFGFSAASSSLKGWVGMEVGLGMLSFGLMIVPSISFNYLIEAYNPVSGDCFVVVVVIRAVISFAWTFFVGEWTESAGAAVPFGVFGGLMGFFSFLIIPLWLMGKRWRIATAGFMPKNADH